MIAKPTISIAPACTLAVAGNRDPLPSLVRHLRIGKGTSLAGGTDGHAAIVEFVNFQRALAWRTSESTSQFEKVPVLVTVNVNDPYFMKALLSLLREL